MTTQHDILVKNYRRINERIAGACRMSGRQRDSVKLLAVSKGQPASKIISLHSNAGQRWFGENYVQELIQKAQLVQNPDIRWSFIGRLQSNKIAKIVKIADEIQSVADSKHAGIIAKKAEEYGKVPYPVFVAVNLGDEDSKGGVSLRDARDLVAVLADDPRLEVRGLMAIPPRDASADLYREISQVSENLGLPDVSLGMSGDLEVAIAAGSTVVRVGQDLFGPRG